MAESVGALLSKSIELRAISQAAHRRADKAQLTKSKISTQSGAESPKDKSLNAVQLRAIAADADCLADRVERALARARLLAGEEHAPPSECGERTQPVRRVRGAEAAALKVVMNQNASSLAWLKPKPAAAWPRLLYVRVHEVIGLPASAAFKGSAACVCVTNATRGASFKVGAPAPITAAQTEPDVIETVDGAVKRVSLASMDSNGENGDMGGHAEPVQEEKAILKFNFEAFIVTCDSPNDTIAVEILPRIRPPVEQPPITTALARLNPHMVCHKKVELPQAGVAEAGEDGVGDVKVIAECFWVDNAIPKKEEGEFYYSIVTKGGATLLKDPSWDSVKTSHRMQFGEIFRSEERFEDISDGTMYVKVATNKDSWARSGWLMERLGEEKWLQAMAPPHRQIGQFFYRVAHPDGVRLHTKASVSSPLHTNIIPAGSIIEASEKFTPVGSTVTYVKCDIKRGFLFEPAIPTIVPPLPPLPSPPPAVPGIPGRPAVRDPETGEVLIESVGCPIGETISEELGHFIFRVTIDSGILVRSEAHITAEPGEALRPQTAFAATARLCKRFEGLGEVVFVQRAVDGGWIRATKSGVTLLELVSDKIEKGPFTYVVIHENGVVVRSAPDLHAAPAKPHTIMPVRKVFQVSERVQKAEDIVSSASPTVFLKIADFGASSGTVHEGWVFEKRGSTKICEDLLARNANVNPPIPPIAQR